MENTQTIEMSKTKQVLSWIAVLPSAILAVLLFAFPIHWLVMWLQMSPSYDGAFLTDANDKPVALLSFIPTEMLEYFANAFFNPLVLIYVGASVAPKFKFQTGIALAIFWAISLGVVMFRVISHRVVEGWNWLHLTITFLLGIAGIGVGLYQAHKIQKEVEYVSSES